MRNQKGAMAMRSMAMRIGAGHSQAIAVPRHGHGTRPPRLKNNTGPSREGPASSDRAVDYRLMSVKITV
jgi:hypothetical protein